MIKQKSFILKIIYNLIYLIKNDKFINFINYYSYIKKNYNNLSSEINLINLKKLLNYKKKKLFKFLRLLIIYKFKYINLFIEINNNKNSDKKGLIYKNYNNNIIKFNRKKNIFKNILMYNNIFKQKLMNKKFYYIWRLKKMNNLRYNKIFLWPLIIIIKPYCLLIKNIYYKQTFKLNKRLMNFKILKFINIKKGNIIGYILNKYINIKNFNLNNYNYLNSNYNLFKQNKIKYYKNNKKKKTFLYFFFKFNKHKSYIYENLIFNKLYNLILFWFLFYINLINNYLNKSNIILWLNKINYLNININMYYTLNLYKIIHNNIKIINNIDKNKIIFNNKNKIKINKIYKYLNIFFIYLSNVNYEYNLFDLINNSDYYKFKNYYKNKYFLNKLFISDIKFSQKALKSSIKYTK